MDAIGSSFENDVPKEVQDGVFNFVEELEDIRFMRNEEEHFEAISNEIAKLDGLFLKYVESGC